MEEIGTNNASLITSSQEWISYDIPTETLKTLPWGDKYIGQIQKWFLFRFTGIDNDINVGTENPEFSEWKWMDYDEISQNAVPFKRNVYIKIQKEFRNNLDKSLIKSFFVSGGFAEINPEKCIVLAESVVEVNSLEKTSIEKEIQELENKEGKESEEQLSIAKAKLEAINVNFYDKI